MTIKELFDLRDQVAIITGGGRGLGLAMAEALAEAGASVVLASRKLEAVQAAADKLNQAGYRAMAMSLDVSNPDDIDTVVDQTRQQWGRIDILINNSGATWGAPALDMPIQAWLKVMRVNVDGTFLMSQRVARVMRPQGGGRIINIASVAGLMGTDPRAMDAVGYSTSKGAIIAMTRDLAFKWAAYNIRVNAIAPGFIPTKMSQGLIEHHGDLLRSGIPLGRFGTTDDVKGAALLLASRASDYMTGAVLTVDGGVSA